MIEGWQKRHGMSSTVCKARRLRQAELELRPYLRTDKILGETSVQGMSIMAF